MSLSKTQQEFTLDIARLIAFADQQGIKLTFGEAYRTNDQQELYFTGKTLRIEDGELEVISGKKRTKTMNSKHLSRLAVDFNFFKDGKLTYKLEDIEILGDYWESLNKNNRAGMFFKSFYDAPHFERRE